MDNLQKVLCGIYSSEKVKLLLVDCVFSFRSAAEIFCFWKLYFPPCYHGLFYIYIYIVHSICKIHGIIQCMIDCWSSKPGRRVCGTLLHFHCSLFRSNGICGWTTITLAILAHLKIFLKFSSVHEENIVWLEHLK
jgi:hypothetical protein